MEELFPDFTSDVIDKLVEQGLAGNDAETAPKQAAPERKVHSRPDWMEKQTLRELRGHDFYPDSAALARIPRIYETDQSVAGAGGKVLHAHYFGPTGDFYVVELDSEGEAFGIFTNNYGEQEMTYMELGALEQEYATDRNGMPRYFERDLHFEPIRAHDALPEHYGERAADRLSREDHDALRAAVDEYREAHSALNDAYARNANPVDLGSRVTQSRAKLEQLLETRQLNVIDPLSTGRLRTTNLSSWKDDEVQKIRTT